MAGRRNARRTAPAAWLALLAVLTLLMSPVLAGRAHAAMISPAPAPMAMGGMAGKGMFAPCHHDGSAACSVACSLASQLLPSQGYDGQPRVEASGRVDYADLLDSLSGAPEEGSTPPPRG